MLAGSLLKKLTQHEQETFQAFVELCQHHEFLHRPEGLREEDLIDGLNDEVTLFRFLRGRGFDINAAFQQFNDALVIRQSVAANIEYEKVDILEFEYARQMYPHWSGCRDKIGKPLCMFDFARLDHDSLTRYHASRRSLLTSDDCTILVATRIAIVFNDYLTRFVLPICSMTLDGRNPETVITSAVYLADASSLTLAQAWSWRLFVRDFSYLLATCYPEVVDKIYILNAPRYFGTIWAVLSKWVDPRTAKKLVIVPSADTLLTLQKTIEIDYIPIQFGGHFHFDYGMPPRVDKGIVQDLALCPNSNSQLPAGPIKLATNEDGQIVIVAVGTLDGIDRQYSIGNTTAAKGSMW